MASFKHSQPKAGFAARSFAVVVGAWQDTRSYFVDSYGPSFITCAAPARNGRPNTAIPRKRSTPSETAADVIRASAGERINPQPSLDRRRARSARGGTRSAEGSSPGVQGRPHDRLVVEATAGSGLRSRPRASRA